MRLLIAGAAGFIGSHLAERYLKDGCIVYGADDLSSGQRHHFEYLKDTYGDAFVPHIFNVGNDRWSMSNEPKILGTTFDGILHFASPASPPDYLKRPFSTIQANVDGTRKLLWLARQNECRFLFASTSEIYGDPLVSPQVESYWGNVNPIGPRSVYDESKRMGETLVSLYNRAYGLDTRIIRIFNTYGPRMRRNDGRVVTNFINQALNNEHLTVYGDGLQTRSLCYIDDLVEGIVRTFELGDHQPINLGNPHEVDMRQLASLIMDLTNTESPGILYESLPEDDPKRRRPDITKAQTLLGWSPQVSLVDGLLKTIEYFKQS
jgi:dTDP-glucose 4,6-dehydratase